MRSFIFIRNGILGTLAAIVCVLFISPAAYALDAPEPYSSIERLHFENHLMLSVAPCVLPGDSLASQCANADKTASTVISFLLVEPLKPDYAESYDTHGQSFAPLRRRC